MLTEQLFKLADRDNGGTVSLDELKQFLTDVPGLTQTEVSSIMRTADADASGDIDPGEFSVLLRTIAGSRPLIPFLETIALAADARLNRMKRALEFAAQSQAPPKSAPPPVPTKGVAAGGEFLQASAGAALRVFKGAFSAAKRALGGKATAGANFGVRLRPVRKTLLNLEVMAFAFTFLSVRSVLAAARVCPDFFRLICGEARTHGPLWTALGEAAFGYPTPSLTQFAGVWRVCARTHAAWEVSERLRLVAKWARPRQRGWLDTTGRCDLSPPLESQAWRALFTPGTARRWYGGWFVGGGPEIPTLADAEAVFLGNVQAAGGWQHGESFWTAWRRAEVDADSLRRRMWGRVSTPRAAADVLSSRLLHPVSRVPLVGVPMSLLTGAGDILCGRALLACVAVAKLHASRRGGSAPRILVVGDTAVYVLTRQGQVRRAIPLADVTAVVTAPSSTPPQLGLLCKAPAPSLAVAAPLQALEALSATILAAHPTPAVVARQTASAPAAGKPAHLPTLLPLRNPVAPSAREAAAAAIGLPRPMAGLDSAHTGEREGSDDDADDADGPAAAASAAAAPTTAAEVSLTRRSAKRAAWVQALRRLCPSGAALAAAWPGGSPPVWVFGVPSAPRSLCPVAAGGGLLLEDVLGYDVTVRLPVVAVPRELQSVFGVLDGAAVYYISVCECLPSRERRVVVVTRSALFTCTLEGVPVRGIPAQAIRKLLVPSGRELEDCIAVIAPPLARPPGPGSGQSGGGGSGGDKGDGDEGPGDLLVRLASHLVDYFVWVLAGLHAHYYAGRPLPIHVGGDALGLPTADPPGCAAMAASFHIPAFVPGIGEVAAEWLARDVTPTAGAEGLGLDPDEAAAGGQSASIVVEEDGFAAASMLSDGSVFALVATRARTPSPPPPTSPPPPLEVMKER